MRESKHALWGNKASCWPVIKAAIGDDCPDLAELHVHRSDAANAPTLEPSTITDRSIAAGLQDILAAFSAALGGLASAHSSGETPWLPAKVPTALPTACDIADATLSDPPRGVQSKLTDVCHLHSWKAMHDSLLTLADDADADHTPGGRSPR